MKCPQCGSGLFGREINGVQFHVCENCGGIWFDRTKLADLRFANQDKLELLNVEVHGTVGPADRNVSLICPACALSLHPFTYALDATLELEVCQKCGGFFIPHVEAKAFADSLRSPVEPVANSSALGEFVPDTDPDEKTFHRVDPNVIVPIAERRYVTNRYPGGWDYGYDYVGGSGASVAADIALVGFYVLVDLL